MPAVPEPLTDLARRRDDPVVVQTLRSTAAAVLSYLAALWLSNAQDPLLAPLTTLLTVQVTLYATLTRGIRRVNAVVAGVLVAVGFSNLVGLSWWSLGVLILASLTVGHLVRVNEFVPEVAISAMLVLGVSVTRVAETALDRVLETLIGAVVGLLFNVLFVPPVWTRSATEAIQDLAGRLRHLIRLVGEELGDHTPVEDAAARLQEARRLDHDIVQVDASLKQAEESLKLNPRVKEGLLSRVVLRTGLDTLEICVVVLRVTARTLTDLAKSRTGEPLFPPREAEALEELFAHLAGAVKAFAVLVTSDVTQDSDTAEERLVEELAAARAARDRIAELLLTGVQHHPRQWQLHGALLAEIDRMLEELDVEKRSMRLAEELDRYTRDEVSGRQRMLAKLTRALHVPLPSGPRRRREDTG
ncbi:aromatic acid exporter family member 1 [Streptomyces sp. Amel2xB2]|uniref:FUSC family protein n=1 Tax=Streptomyces sp. Amel2xB2 TaxID=1305829 RepID=UPI000DB923DA|nr:aromatic acid exporter family protein [Streptomyces sp. Amel2xB2]RAJ67117.1 aromatic acid exporter family member 1 [Streptomyces sp. Amel2xB2]